MYFLFEFQLKLMVMVQNMQKLQYNSINMPSTSV